MLEVRIIGVEQVIAHFKDREQKLKVNTLITVRDLTLQLQKMVREEYLSGQALKVRTGNLRRSITYKVDMVPEQSVTGIVGTNSVYAAIHEFGGKTPPHDIVPKYAKALMFGSGLGAATSKMGRYLKSGKARKTIQAALNSGNARFAKVVHHPGSKIPMRSFLRAALEQMRPMIRVALLNEVHESMK